MVVVGVKVDVKVFELVVVGVKDAVELFVLVAVLVPVNVDVPVAVEVRVNEGVELKVLVAVFVKVKVAVAVGVDEGVELAVLTAVFVLVEVTVDVNVGVEGCVIICIAPTLALTSGEVAVVANVITIWPFTGAILLNTLSSAIFWPPASAKMSKFVSTWVPLIVTF